MVLTLTWFRTGNLPTKSIHIRGKQGKQDTQSHLRKFGFCWCKRPPYVGEYAPDDRPHFFGYIHPIIMNFTLQTSYTCSFSGLQTMIAMCNMFSTKYSSKLVSQYSFKLQKPSHTFECSLDWNSRHRSTSAPPLYLSWQFRVEEPRKYPACIEWQSLS